MQGTSAYDGHLSYSVYVLVCFDRLHVIGGAVLGEWMRTKKKTKLRKVHSMCLLAHLSMELPCALLRPDFGCSKKQWKYQTYTDVHTDTHTHGHTRTHIHACTHNTYNAHQKSTVSRQPTGKTIPCKILFKTKPNG